jgi:hypothetical protein
MLILYYGRQYAEVLLYLREQNYKIACNLRAYPIFDSAPLPEERRRTGTAVFLDLSRLSMGVMRWG